MRRLALIPARGGSKRLPRKNIADFMGKPMIAWTIGAAKESGLFEKVVVSTEDSEIAAIAKKYGAETAVRNPALATDKARVLDVCLDFLDQDEKAGRACDVLCCLYATAPLRTAADIRAASSLLNPGKCDFSLCATHYSLPPHQALRLGNNGAVTPMWPDLISKRDEEVGELVVDNGSTYFVSVLAFRKHKTFFGPNTWAHIMPRERSHDINEPVDLEILKIFAAQAAA